MARRGRPRKGTQRPAAPHTPPTALHVLTCLLCARERFLDLPRDRAVQYTVRLRCPHCGCGFHWLERLSGVDLKQNPPGRVYAVRETA